MIDLLREQMAERGLAEGVDWQALARPESHLGQANALIDHVVARLRAVSAGAARR
jgi:hypothetical protein